MNRLAIVALLLMGSTFAASSNASLTAADEKELQSVALALKKAIVLEDIDGIINHLSKAGLTCTDTHISYQRVVRDLRNRNSHLYLSLFDSGRFSKQCGKEYPSDYPAISDKEFFTSARDQRMEIKPLDSGWAQVIFTSDTKNQYPREWTFHKQGGQWRFADGFVVSRCSCG
jgi:hypothetical protein